MKIFVDPEIRIPALRRLDPLWSTFGFDMVSLPDAQVYLAHNFLLEDPGIPVVLRMDGIAYNEGALYGRFNDICRKTYNKAIGVIFQSYYTKGFIEHYWGARENSTVIYNGIDPGWNDPLPHDTFNIVLCANWQRWKRLDQMLDIVSSVEHPGTKLHVIGEPHGSHRKRPGVEYYGYLSQDGIRESLRRMDLALHLAKRDWCPSTILEFTAAGIPTLVSDKGGGATELMQMICPKLIVPGDYDPVEYSEAAMFAEAWNSISPEFQSTASSMVREIIEDGFRVSLPEILCLHNMAQGYSNFIGRVCNAV